MVLHAHRRRHEQHELHQIICTGNFRWALDTFQHRKERCQARHASWQRMTLFSCMGIEEFHLYMVSKCMFVQCLWSTFNSTILTLLSCFHLIENSSRIFRTMNFLNNFHNRHWHTNISVGIGNIPIQVHFITIGNLLIREGIAFDHMPGRQTASRQNMQHGLNKHKQQNECVVWAIRSNSI